jgi:hypothetical protein
LYVNRPENFEICLEKDEKDEKIGEEFTFSRNCDRSASFHYKIHHKSFAETIISSDYFDFFKIFDFRSIEKFESF